MTIELKKLLAAVAMWADEDKDVKSGTYIDIVSGGIQKFIPDAEPPVLYLEEDDAVSAWLISCRDFFINKPRAKFRWVEKPALDKWIMTAQHSTGSHRQVSHRYSVYSRIMIEDVS